MDWLHHKRKGGTVLPSDYYHQRLFIQLVHSFVNGPGYFVSICIHFLLSRLVPKDICIDAAAYSVYVQSKHLNAVIVVDKFINFELALEDVGFNRLVLSQELRTVANAILQSSKTVGVLLKVGEDHKDYCIFLNNINTFPKAFLDS